MPFIQGVTNGPGPTVLPAFFGTAAQATAMGFKPSGVGAECRGAGGQPAD